MSDRQMSERGPADVARALVDAAFSGNYEAAAACCTPDLELRIEGIQTVHGHEGLRHVMEFNGEVSTDVRVTIHHVLAAGDTVSARGFGKFELAEVGGTTKKGRTSILVKRYI